MVINKILDCKFDVKSFSEEDNENFRFNGYLSTFGNVDFAGDIVEKGAFERSLKLRMPKLFFEHDSKVPVGIFDDAKEDGHGLFVEGKMPRSDTFVSGRMIPQMRIGAIDRMSIGCSIVKSVPGKKDDVFRRKLVDLDLWEGSLTCLPMNDQAVIMQMKSAIPYQDLSLPENESGGVDYDYSWDAPEALKRVRNYFDSVETPSADYHKAFLWHDKENKDNLDSYKHLIADVVNGKLCVIPKALYSASAIVKGARSAVDIPEHDRAEIISNIEKYFDRMQKESPFQKGFGSHIDTFSSIKDVSSFLKSFGLSDRETTALINRTKNFVNINRNYDEKCLNKKIMDDILTAKKNLERIMI